MKRKCPDCKGELEEVFTEYIPDQSRVISYEPRYKCPICHQEYAKEVEMKTYLICGLFKGTDLIVAKRLYSREEAEEYIQGHEIYLQGYPMYIIESTECMKGGLKCTD